MTTTDLLRDDIARIDEASRRLVCKLRSYERHGRLRCCPETMAALVRLRYERRIVAEAAEVAS